MFLFLIIIFISCNSTNKPTCLDISERPDERDYIMKIERERENTKIVKKYIYESSVF